MSPHSWHTWSTSLSQIPERSSRLEQDGTELSSTTSPKERFSRMPPLTISPRTGKLSPTWVELNTLEPWLSRLPDSLESSKSTRHPPEVEALELLLEEHSHLTSRAVLCSKKWLMVWRPIHLRSRLSSLLFCMWSLTERTNSESSVRVFLVSAYHICFLALDFKSATPSVYLGDVQNGEKANATVTVADNDFVDIAAGKLNAQKVCTTDSTKSWSNNIFRHSWAENWRWKETSCCSKSSRRLSRRPRSPSCRW